MAENLFTDKLKDIIRLAYDKADATWLTEHIIELTKIEYKQTFSAYKKSAEYVKNLLIKEGFDAEVLTFPADGKTTYQDKRSPLAWEASIGRLTIKSAPLKFDDPVIADFEKMPFSLVKHSTALPDGGIVTKLVTEAQVYAGEDVRGAIVLLEEGTRPQGHVIKPLLDLGALGFVTEFLKGGINTPDAIQWVNALTEGNHWHVQKDDRDFVAFSISHKTASLLRKAANSGNVEVLVECDGKRYEGKLEAVTSLIPGKNKKELWVLAHLYEPLLTDNSMGVISAIEVMKLLRNMVKDGMIPPPHFSIRLVFAMEMYGFAQVCEYFGGNLRDKTIGAVVMDAFCASKFPEAYNEICYAPLAVPFFGNYVMEMTKNAYNVVFMASEIKDGSTSFGDDMFLSDPTCGLPTIFPREEGTIYQHSSIMVNDYIDTEKLIKSVAFFTAFICGIAYICKEDFSSMIKEAAMVCSNHIKRHSERENVLGKNSERIEFLCNAEKNCLLDFGQISDVSEYSNYINSIIPLVTEENEITSKWLNYAENIIPARTHRGFPHDLIKLPKSNRKTLSGSIIYGPLAFVLAAIDGKKTLARAICEASWETNSKFTDKDIKSIVNNVIYLKDAGYLSATNKAEISKDMIKAALSFLGIKQGDILLVHSGLSYLGEINGGANGVIDALLETVDNTGTVLMPAFTRPYISFEGTLNKRSNFRPFNKNDKENISTGAISKAFLQREGCLRSEHSTHSWCGIGAKAEECLAHHTP